MPCLVNETAYVSLFFQLINLNMDMFFLALPMLRVQISICLSLQFVLESVNKRIG